MTTNSQFLYDIIISNRYFTRDEIRVKAVIVVSSDEELDTFTFVGGHLVLVFDDGSIIDPSYDIFSFILYSDASVALYINLYVSPCELSNFAVE